MLSVSQLTRMLAAEGVARIVITTEEPGRYRGVRLAPDAKVRHRDELAQVAARAGRRCAGVTVIIHDQTVRRPSSGGCVKRGTAPAPPSRRVWINERVCEGCGDCGEKSGCLSVVPVQTRVRPKDPGSTRAPATSDMSCLNGDCPSFFDGRAGAGPRTAAPSRRPTCPSPRRGGRRRAHPHARHRRHRRGDGLADRGDGGAPGGPVRRPGSTRPGSPRRRPGRLRPAARRADADRGGPCAPPTARSTCCSASTCSARHEQHAERRSTRERTIAVVSCSLAPTGEMVPTLRRPRPTAARLLGGIELRATQWLWSRRRATAKRLFGDDACCQRAAAGCRMAGRPAPVGWQALGEPIELNGAAVELNLMALPGAARSRSRPRLAAQLVARRPLRRSPGGRGAGGLRLPSEPVRELCRPCAADTCAPGAGAAWPALPGTVRSASPQSSAVGAPGRTELTETVAGRLHKLIAYKDEYEVARLHLLPAERERRERSSGPDAKWWLHLHPPLLRAIGIAHKLRLGRRSCAAPRRCAPGRRLGALRSTPSATRTSVGLSARSPASTSGAVGTRSSASMRATTTGLWHVRVRRCRSVATSRSSCQTCRCGARAARCWSSSCATLSTTPSSRHNPRR